VNALNWFIEYIGALCAIAGGLLLAAAVVALAAELTAQAAKKFWTVHRCVWAYLLHRKRVEQLEHDMRQQLWREWLQEQQRERSDA
jgi:hypothetical protein